MVPTREPSPAARPAEDLALEDAPSAYWTMTVFVSTSAARAAGAAARTSRPQHSAARTTRGMWRSPCGSIVGKRAGAPFTARTVASGARVPARLTRVGYAREHQPARRRALVRPQEPRREEHERDRAQHRRAGEE